MASQADVAFSAVQSFRWVLDLRAVQLVDIDVENFRSIQRHLDRLASHLDLFEVPFSDWPEIAVLRADAMIERAVILIGQERLLRMRGVVTITINHLDFEAVG